jgi:hypothetical protein
MTYDRRFGRFSSFTGAVLLVLTGCMFFPTFPGTVSDVAANGDANRATPAVDGATRVELVNLTRFPAVCQVAMTLTGSLIHQAQRRIPPNGTSVIEGPDNADLVSISATLDGLDGFSQGPTGFVLGTDYQSGETIRFVIALPALDLRVAVGFDQNLTVEAGTVVDLPLGFEGAAAQTTFSLFADPDDTPNSGNEIPIAIDLPAAGRDRVAWDTTGVAPGTYCVYAEARSGDQFFRSPPASGKITILPTLAASIGGLEQTIVVESGASVPFTVTTSGTASSTPTFSAFAQSVSDPAAEAIVIAENLPAPGMTEVIWQTITQDEQVVPAGTYRVFAVLTDGDRSLTSATTAGNVVILPNLAVRVSAPAIDVTVQSGTIVEILVEGSGTDANGFLTLFADEVESPGRAGDIVIADNVRPVESATVLWDTTGIGPGTYEIHAELTDSTNTRSIESSPATGRVIITPDLSIAIGNLEEDVTVEPFESVDFNVLTGGTTDPNATFCVFAIADDGNDPNFTIQIATGVPAAPLTPITWNLGQTKTSSGVYRVFAILRDGPRTLRSSNAPGRVIVLSPLQIDILNLNQDIIVGPGDIVPIEVATGGTLDPNASFTLFVSAVEEPNVPIAEEVPAEPFTVVQWDTVEFPSGTYRVSGRLADPKRGEAYTTAFGRVTISTPPTLTVTDPNGPLELLRGDLLSFGWTADDPEEDAQIAFYLDPDTVFNGNEYLLVDGISEDAEPSGSRKANTNVAPGGTYNILGVIDDGFSTGLAYGQTVCVSEALFGVFAPSDLDPGQITEIRGLSFGDPNMAFPRVFNSSFGYSVNLSRDVTGDGAADLVVGDPFALIDEQEPFEVGAAYYHQQPGAWPRDLTVDDLHSRAIGPQFESKFGASVALTAPLGSSAFGEVLVGAPLTDSGKGGLHGTAYYIDGDGIVFNPGDINFDPNGPVSSVEGSFFNDEQLGSAVAAVGDVDNDTHDDTAVGSPYHNAARGRVTLLSGAQGLPDGAVDDIGETIDGSIWEGTLPDEQAGFSVSGAALFNADAYADFLVGAPGRTTDAGCVYLVYGSANAMDGGTHQLDMEAGVRFDAEFPGDRAGASVGVAFVDADSTPDILIGAPGANGGSGRVYLIYGNQVFPPKINLDQVGGMIAGAVFDGEPGSALGAAVSGAADFNNDGFGDFVLGAPDYNDSRGAAHLVYGSAELSGNTSLTSACGAPGVMYIGDDYGDRFGAAVSGGASANGDEFGDIAVGAPGANRAYVIFGISFGGPVVTCLGDVDSDGDVDITDLGLVLANFGQAGESLPGDLDGDGDVDITDLGVLLAEFGQFCD